MEGILEFLRGASWLPILISGLEVVAMIIMLNKVDSANRKSISIMWFIVKAVLNIVLEKSPVWSLIMAALTAIAPVSFVTFFWVCSIIGGIVSLFWTAVWASIKGLFSFLPFV